MPVRGDNNLFGRPFPAQFPPLCLMNGRTSVSERAMSQANTDAEHARVDLLY
jgi:hypothetical protein